MDTTNNIILKTDAYKQTHWKQHPSGLIKMYAYGEPRTGGKYPEICLVGPSMIIQKHFLGEVTKEMIEEAEEECYMTFGTTSYFNREVWEKVRQLGYFPMRIKCAPEGTILPINNVAFTIESTEDWFAKTVNQFEDLFMHAWYPTAVATRARAIKNKLYPIFNKTCDDPNLNLPWAVNDFGYRGGNCHEGSTIGGLGFLVYFRGSDNMYASKAVKDYYGLKGRALSIWATEHAVATCYGLKPENEMEYVIAQLTRCETHLPLAIVIDSKDSDNFMQNVVGDPGIKQMIKERAGRTIFRTDSGDPKINIIKYLDILGGIFGYSINHKGCKVIKENVGLIQSDGMNEQTIPELYEEVTKVGWSADNFVIGSGGGLLEEDLTRDTSRWAIKASYGEKIIEDGKGPDFRKKIGFNIQKDPATDLTKKSKAGILKLSPTGRTFITMQSSEKSKETFNGYVDALETIYENGKFTNTKFEDIIERANK